MAPAALTNRQLLQIIMVAVAIWGSTLALGAFLFGRDPETGNITLSINPMRGLIVFGCVASFLGFWAIMLATRGGEQLADETAGNKNEPKYETSAIPGDSRQESAKRPMSDLEFRGWLVFVMAATIILFFECCVAMNDFAVQRSTLMAASRLGFVVYVFFALWQGNPFARWLIVAACLLVSVVIGYVALMRADVFAISLATIYLLIAVTFVCSSSFRLFLNYQNDVD